LDLRHRSDPDDLARSQAEWVRDLYRGGVIVSLAAQDGAERLEDVTNGHGAFIEGWIMALREGTGGGAVRDPRGAPMTLEQLEAGVRRWVVSLTSGRQQPGFQYGDFAGDTPALDPGALERRSVP